MRAKTRRSASPAPSNPSPRPMQAHRFSPVKGSVLLEEPAEPCEEVALDPCDELELTELGADWDSVDEPEGVVLEVVVLVDVPVLVPVLVLPDLALWWPEWEWLLSGSTYWELPAEPPPPPPPAKAAGALSRRPRTTSPQASIPVRERITGYSSSVRGLRA
jgi:hypothetical protein